MNRLTTHPDGLFIDPQVMPGPLGSRRSSVRSCPKALFPLLLLGLFSASIGCDRPLEPAGSTATVIGPGGPVEHPDVQGTATSRSTMRLTVDMLAASIPVVAGNDLQGRPITWKAEFDGRTVDALSDQALAPTLGKPDYVTVTDEPAEPSALYLKFMDDMARDVCPRILSADEGRTEASSRTLLRYASWESVTDEAALLENLKYLKLRFHGRKVTDDAEVASLRQLFESAVASMPDSSVTEQAKTGWNSVCVALFLSPEFHIY